jgi:NlpC/P60 family putative phage cell wall peptidase
MDTWPPLTGVQIVDAARDWIGTPWHHDARMKGAGVDCVGLPICVFQGLGVPVEDVRGYSLDRDGYALMRDVAARYGEEVTGDIAAGDLLLFRSRMIVNHMGIATGPGGMVHAWNSPTVMAVAEHPLDRAWLSRIAAVYRYRGIV